MYCLFIYFYLLLLTFIYFYLLLFTFTYFYSLLLTFTYFYLLFLQNNPVTQLGSFLEPWNVAVTMEMTSSSDNRALLDGTLDVSFSGSWANFTNLTISHSGTYRLHFNVSSPADAVSFPGVTFDVIVPLRRLSGQFASQPSSVFAGDTFNVSVELLDADTNTVLDITWKVRAFVTKHLTHPVN